MAGEPNEIHAETDAARAGSTPHIVRWILGISLFAAIALLSLIWILGAGLQGEPDSTAEMRSRALQEYGDQGGVLASDAEVSEATGGGAVEATASPTVAPAAEATASPAAAD
jgi:hypothetical protein